MDSDLMLLLKVLLGEDGQAPANFTMNAICLLDDAIEVGGRLLGMIDLPSNVWLWCMTTPITVLSTAGRLHISICRRSSRYAFLRLPPLPLLLIVNVMFFALSGPDSILGEK